jgi:hypothetical protein
MPDPSSSFTPHFVRFTRFSSLSPAPLLHFYGMKKKQLTFFCVLILVGLLLAFFIYLHYVGSYYCYDYSCYDDYVYEWYY